MFIWSIQPEEGLFVLILSLLFYKRVKIFTRGGLFVLLILFYLRLVYQKCIFAKDNILSLWLFNRKVFKLNSFSICKRGNNYMGMFGCFVCTIQVHIHRFNLRPGCSSYWYF